MAQYSPAVVVDNGSSTCKAGFAGEDLPRFEFNTVIGHPFSLAEASHASSLIGHFVDQERRDLIVINHPIERGVVTAWDDMEKIWHNVYSGLNASPEEHAALFTTTPTNPKLNREKMSEIMFEKFNVPSFYVAIQPLLTLAASAEVEEFTGIVFDSGDGVSHATPFHDGDVLPSAILRLPLAGRDVTDYLAKILFQRGHSFAATPAGRKTVSKMKKSLCCRPHGSVLTSEPRSRCFSYGYERFQCTEALFRPSLVGMDLAGFDQTIHNSISLCNEDIQQELYANIIISGGNTLFKGFASRLKEGIKALAPPSTVVNVIAPRERYYSVWLGGSLLASVDAFPVVCASKEEYKESGPSIVHEKALCNY